MNKETKKLLESYLNIKNYKKYNELMRKEIIIYFVTRIKEKEPDYLYSNMVELQEIVEEYLGKKEIVIFNDFYLSQKLTEEPQEMSSVLTKIYKRITQIEE